VKRAPKPDPVKPRPPTARRFYFTELAVPSVYIFAHPTSSPTLLMQLRSQATVEIHHAALSSLPSRSDCAPRVSIASFPGLPQVSPRPQRPPTYPSDWLLRSRATGVALVMTAKMTSVITLGASGRGISPCRPRKDTGGRPYHHPYDYSVFSALMRVVEHLAA
jgi:hypothetical protein